MNINNIRDTLENVQLTETGTMANSIDTMLLALGFFANIGIAAYKGFTDQQLFTLDGPLIIQGAIYTHSSLSSMIRTHERRHYKGNANYTPLGNLVCNGIGNPAILAGIAAVAQYAGKAMRSNL